MDVKGTLLLAAAVAVPVTAVQDAPRLAGGDPACQDLDQLSTILQLSDSDPGSASGLMRKRLVAGECLLTPDTTPTTIVEAADDSTYLRVRIPPADRPSEGQEVEDWWVSREALIGR